MALPSVKAMPGVLDFLERLRPAGAPGAAGASAVPGDRRQEAEAELAPLFEMIDEHRRQAEKLRTDAATEAESLLRDAERQADQIVEQAQRRAAIVRAESSAAVRTATEAELAAIAAESARTADSIRLRAAGLLPSRVDDVVAESISLVGL